MANSHSTKRAALLELADKIKAQAESLHAYLEESGHSQPSWDANDEGPPETVVYEDIRTELAACLEDLQMLVDGPKRFLRSWLTAGIELAALQTAFALRLFQLVPLQKGISLESLAAKADVDADIVARVLRMLATRRIFHEKEPGVFSHSAISALIHRDEEIRCSGEYS